MIQHYRQLKEQIEKINNKNDLTGQVQKIYSTSLFVCITIRFPGKTKFLYFGRGSGFEGVWDGTGAPESKLRCVDKFLEYLRKHLTGSRFGKLILHPKDRVVVVPYVKKQVKNYLMIFWSGRLMYFSNYYWDFVQNQYKYFCSWDGHRAVNTNDLPEENLIKYLANYFIPVGLREIEESVADRGPVKAAEIISIDDLLDGEHRKLDLRMQKTQGKKSLLRKMDKIKKDLDRVKQWREIQEILLKGNLNLESVQEIDLCGWHFKFPTSLGHHKKMSVIFEKMKNLKKAEVLLERRFEDVVDLATKKEVSKTVQRKILAPVWKLQSQSSKSEQSVANDGMIKVLSLVVNNNNFKIGVGLNSQGNDHLRNKWAVGDDYWFHLDGITSSHIVLKLGDRQLEQDLLKIVGSILAEYSNFSSSWVPVVYTKVKNLKSVKGSPGKVTYKKERHINLECDCKWRDFIS